MSTINATASDTYPTPRNVISNKKGSKDAVVPGTSGVSTSSQKKNITTAPQQRSRSNYRKNSKDPNLNIINKTNPTKATAAADVLKECNDSLLKSQESYLVMGISQSLVFSINISNTGR